MNFYIAVFILSGVCLQAYSQENAQLQIPPSLLECYQNGTYLYRDNRLPMTLDVLISLIEKVENAPNYNNDIRQVSNQLIQRFRQDGIERAYNVNAGPNVIPYSPIGFQFPKFRILLSRLIPGNAFTFPNSTLTRQERCTLHFMLSSSFDTRTRGDEGQTCSRISQYRSNRLPRSLRNNFKGDVEILHDFDIKKNSGSQRTNPYYPLELEFDDGPFNKNPNINPKNDSKNPNGNKYGKNFVDYGYNNNNNNGYGPNQISSCPVENGVIRTPYGTVSAGTVIAGIAAGLAYQNINLQQLLQLSRRGRLGNFQQLTSYTIDNRFAATLAGDLAEVALVQVPTSQNGVTIGANGGWNNTAYPEWYFLQQNSDLEMTDAEIRGGLDGLILSMNVQSWKSQTSNLRLSQVLRMYYSSNGVLGTNIMACNRKQLFSTYAPTQTLQDQTAAFAQLLDREMQLQVTLLPEAIVNFSTQAANALSNYIPNNLNDVSCSAVINPGSPGGNTNNNGSTLATDLIIFYDPSNNYNDVSPAISYIVNNLNMGDFTSGSTVSMISTFDGSVIVNRTHFAAEFFGNFTPTRFNNNYWSGGSSFNLASVFNSALNMSNNILNSEKYYKSIGGKSLVALVIPGNGQVNNNNNNMNPTYDNNGNPNYYLQRELQNLYEDAPDLYFIYYANGNIQRFNNYVINQQKDLFNLQPPAIGTSAAGNANPVLQRISEIPRRIINYQCGSAWYQPNTIQYIGKQFIVPGVTNFYRLHPNYFFGAYNQRFLKIQQGTGTNGASLTVCSSRSVIHPTQALQQSTNGITCQPISGNTPFQIDLSNACSDASMIHFCSPVYVSVYTPNPNGNTNSNNGNSNNGNNNGYNGNSNGYNGNNNGYNGNNNGYNGNSNGYNGNNNGYNGNNNGYNGNSNGYNGNNNGYNGNSGGSSQIQVSCLDQDCPLPNMIMFNIEVDNLGCYSSGDRLISSLIVLLITFLINRFV